MGPNPAVCTFSATLPSGGVAAVTITNAKNADINAINTLFQSVQDKLPGVYKV